MKKIEKTLLKIEKKMLPKEILCSTLSDSAWFDKKKSAEVRIQVTKFKPGIDGRHGEFS